LSTKKVIIVIQVQVRDANMLADPKGKHAIDFNEEMKEKKRKEGSCTWTKPAIGWVKLILMLVLLKMRKLGPGGAILRYHNRPVVKSSTVPMQSMLKLPLASWPPNRLPHFTLDL
jgi:hypothetical protein